MKYIIILVIVFVLFIIFKKRIANYILEKKTPKIEQKAINTEFVYTPIMASRIFDFSIEITETGGGKAILSVVKKPFKNQI